MPDTAPDPVGDENGQSIGSALVAGLNVEVDYLRWLLAEMQHHIDAVFGLSPIPVDHMTREEFDAHEAWLYASAESRQP